MKYKECENCGASLDPGEVCDCEKALVPMIRCDQPPVIFENLESVKQNLDSILETVRGLPKNDESLAQVKKLRSGLTKDHDIIKAQRKAARDLVLAPFNQVDEKYKQYIAAPYEAADAELKAWVDEYQGGMKDECEAKLREYFDEVCRSMGIDFVPFNRCGVVVDMAMARKKDQKKEREQIYFYLQSVRDDMDALMAMEDPEQLMAEYRKTLNFGQACLNVQSRKLAEERARHFVQKFQQERQEKDAHNAEILAEVPELQPEPEEVYETAFRAEGTLRALRALKAFATANGIKLTKIEEDEQ